MNPLTHPAITLAFLGAVVTLGYILACWADPFPRCRTCTGSGRRRTRIGHSWRDCRRCRGTGHRLRRGRRAFNTIAALASEGNRRP